MSLKFALGVWFHDCHYHPYGLFGEGPLQIHIHSIDHE